MKKGSITMFQIPPLMVFEYEGDMNKLLKHVEHLEYMRGGFAEGTADRSRSKSCYVLDDDNLKELKEFCLNSVNQYLDEVLGGVEEEIEIQQSWVNYNKPGQFQGEHYHPNSFVSGVFYLKSNPENGAPISFKSELHKNNFSINILQRNSQAHYPSTGYEFTYPSISGQLILFSSTVTHAVPMNNSDSDRISLSFNTYPKLPFGNELGLTRVRG